MIIVYCFCQQDQELALKNIQWWRELGDDFSKHEVIMGYDKRCDHDIVDQCLGELKVFRKVHPFPFQAEIDGWPQGANYFFRTIAARLETKPETPAFFWMEPDAIPLRAGWFDALVKEYEAKGKLFMGDRVQVGDIPLHMSGIGFYPLPLHKYSGEAYMAHEVAWDMAGRDRIVSQAHFTDLIEHAWKHPTFAAQKDLDTQINKKTVLFHSSKDGSLIDRLRERKQPNSFTGIDAPKEPEEPGSPLPISFIPVPKPDQTRENPLIGAAQGAVAGDKRHKTTQPSADGSPTATTNGGTPSDHPTQLECDIFIRTYPKDYPWLNHCIRSIQKYARGFRKVWIISPEAFPFPVQMEKIEWKQLNEETEDGYLAQQIHKLYADVITGYEAPYILHLDSDTLFTREVTPYSFFTGGRVQWFYTPYEHTQTPWKPITEKFLGHTVENEFMRRLPMMVPRWLHAKLREHCYKVQGMIISDYIRLQPYREFSEFNALGAYAYHYHREEFNWTDTTKGEMPPTFARQFFSWGGITPEVKKEIDQIFNGSVEPVVEKGEPGAVPTISTAPTPLLSDHEQMREMVLWLRKYAEKGKHERSCLMQSLRHQGLSARWGKPKQRRKF